MDALISELMPLYERERAGQRPMALAVVLQTAGSTYSKRGAPLLISREGDYSGLLSGGCLEGDLCAHAREVIDSGAARQVSYDSRGPDDQLFGLGSGCEGAMSIFLMRVGPEQGWQPLAHFQHALAAHQPTAVGLVIESMGAALRPGEVLLPGMAEELDPMLTEAARSGRSDWLPSSPASRVFALSLVLPLRLLLLGAGPDAGPLAGLAAQLGWKVSLYDHRPAFARAARFPVADSVMLGRPEALPANVALNSYDAVVIMSHHLESDAAYVRALASSTVPYVGLLGPAPRRERLRGSLRAEFAALGGRLRSPVGLALGGRASTSIALAIVAEINACW
ncbi:MAG: XdhC family protein, partial [Proteobacteria bacterium]|nr:XdhC family protein [Pseudomonadota bacterium]